MAAVAFKPAWQPLVDLILKKTCKKKTDIPGLMCGPPLGLMPKGMEREVAAEFVKTYIPSLFKKIKAAKQKENMLHLRKELKAATAVGDAAGAAKAADGPPVPKVIGYPDLEEMIKNGMSEDAILAAKGLKFVEIFAWRRAFEAFDPDKNGLLEGETIAKIFESLDRECDPVDSKDIIMHMSNGVSDEKVTFLQFVVFLHGLTKETKQRNKTFGHAFALFARKDKAKSLKPDDLGEGLANLGCEMDEEALPAFAKKVKDKKSFAKLFGGQMTALTKSGKAKKSSKKAAPKKAAVAVTIDPKSPKYKKYFKMKAMHLPAAAALGKAKMDGLSEGELEALGKML